MVASAIQTTTTPANIIANPAAVKSSSLLPRSIFDMNRDQVDRLMMLADVIAGSQLSYSKMGKTKLSKGDVALVMLKGLSVGLTEMAALDLIDLIVGKPALKPQGMLALIYDSGELESIRFEDDGNCALVTVKRKGMPEHVERFSMDDAARMKTTEWDNGAGSSRTIPLSEKSNWKQQPAVMRKWRAVSAMARIIFPDIIQGMYTPEELDPNLVVDEDGNVIGGTITMDAPKKAGETYLATVDGKNRLAALLLELGITKKEDYALVFTALNVTTFGESTLNETDLHDAIRKAAATSVKPAITEPAAPTVEAEPTASTAPAASAAPETTSANESAGWANPNTVGLLVTLMRQRTVENLSEAEMARLAGISPANDYDAWNAKYLTGKVAGDAIVGQFMSEMKPAQPKLQSAAPAAPFQWDDDTRKQADTFLNDRFQLSMPIALEMIGKPLESFTNFHDFTVDVWKAAFGKGTPFYVSKVQYHPSDPSKKNGGGYSTFPEALLPAKMYGSSDKFKALGESFDNPEFLDALKAGKLLDLPLVVKVLHKPAGADAKDKSQQVVKLEIDIPF